MSGARATSRASGRPKAPRQASDLGPLEDIFGAHVGLAHSAIIQDFKRTMDPLPLTPKQTALLWMADETPGIAQIDVARRLLVDRATMLGITNNLVRRGLLERRKPPHGGRRIGLHLTQAGSEILVQAKKSVREHEARLKSRFTAEELRVTIDVLRRIHSSF